MKKPDALVSNAPKQEEKTGIVKIVEWMDGGQIATRLNANLAPIETANIYVVKAGDSLSALSQLRDVPISVLLAYNPQITDPSKIIAGEQIYIPLQLPLLHGFNSSLTVATSADGTLPNIDSIAYANGLERFQLQAANPLHPSSLNSAAACRCIPARRGRRRRGRRRR